MGLEPLTRVCTPPNKLVHRDRRDIVVSLNKGTPIKTPIYSGLYYRDPQKGTPNLGKAPYVGMRKFWATGIYVAGSP